MGVAPDTSILALNVFGTNGRASYSDILDALDWVLLNKDEYNIVAANMSLGANSSSTPCGSDGLADTVTDLKTAGIATSVSSGNDGYTDSISAPACAPDAVSVGAVYDGNYGTVTWSSCTDTTIAADKVTCFSNSASFLTMLSPGTFVTAAGIGMSGTSQAAPHVAGAVAVLKGNDGTLTVDEVVSALTGSGVAVLDTRNNITKPRLDVYAALDASSPYISLSPSGMIFRTSEGGVNTADMLLSISNTGAGILDWSAGDDASWLTLNPLSGSGDGNVTLSVNTSGLTMGTYSATVTVTSATALNSPQTVPVTLDVIYPAFFEDFETGDLSHIQWLTGGSGQWFLQSSTVHSGTYALQSPVLADGQSAYIETTLNICSEGYVYFWLKTSTEPQWDNLKFYVDGMNEGKWDGWHGETPWTEARSAHQVEPGLHTFQWIYSNMSGGNDTVWLDNIVFPEFMAGLADVEGQYYSAIQSAYDSAPDGGSVKIQAFEFTEELNLNRDVAVTFDCGYDCTFETNASSTTLNGALVVSSGTVTVENLVIK